MFNFKNRNVKKKIRHYVGWIGAACYFLLAGMLLFGANGFAYIDPSVMTYVIQAISGLVIAVGVVLGIYWRRAKKKINEKFDIDENKNKEVESDDIEVYKK